MKKGMGMLIKRSGFAAVIAMVLGITLIGLSRTALGLAQSGPAAPAVADSAAVEQALAGSPVMFIENVGQFPEGARFQVRGGSNTMWLAEDAIWVTVLEKPSSPQPPSPNLREGGLPLPSPRFGRGVGGEGQPRKGVNLRLSFVGANPHPRIEPFDRLDTHVSYFIGNDPENWRPDVPVWGGVRYVDLYPGLDLEMTGEGGHLVQRLVAQPGVDLSAVRLRVEGADALTVDGERLHLTTAVGEFTLPLLMVEGSDIPRSTPSVERVTWNMQPATFDVTAPFSFTPMLPNSFAQTAGASDLLYSTFLGGGSGEKGEDIAVDASGAAYVTGWTESDDFPTTSGAFDRTYNGGDAFVVKLNAMGSAPAYATFLGGGGEEWGYGIAVDASGAAYVTGYTSSADFPTTSGAFDRTYNGGGIDAFVVKLNAAGTVPAYATFLGGGSGEKGEDIAVDASGAAYVTGWTRSSDFPTTSGAFDRMCGTDGDCNYDPPYFYYSDAFVVKLNAMGSAPAYATFLGGGDDDGGYGIAIDGSGAAYVTGSTQSPDFPTTPGAFDRSHGGSGERLCSYSGSPCSDAFVLKLNSTGSALAYATFLGGDFIEGGSGIAVDGSGAAYVTGTTDSVDFPTTPGAFDTSFDGNMVDAFVVKLSATGSALVYATLLGGHGTERYTGNDNGSAIAVDASGAVYVTGETVSSDFPTTPGAFDRSHNGDWDTFVVKLNGSGSALAYATFLGGGGSDWGHGIAVDSSGAAYVTGQTYSSDFPTTSSAYDRSYNGGYGDAFVAKLAVGGPGPTPTPTPTRTPTRTPTATVPPTATRTPTPGLAYSISGRVTDGHGNPLVGVYVGLLDANNSLLDTRYTDAQGNYFFRNVAPQSVRRVRVILRDANSRKQILWGDNGLLVSADTPMFIVSGSNYVRNVDFGDSTLDSGPVPFDKLDDLAGIYYHTYEVERFVFNNLGYRDYQPVKSVWAYAPSSVVRSDYADYTYTPGRPNEVQEIHLGNWISDRASSSKEWTWNQPMNREWHENFHHLMNVRLGMPPNAGKENNHGGYQNSTTDDSWAEGWAEFWPSVLKDVYGGPSPHLYYVDASGPVSFENNWKAWDSSLFSRQREDYAVASLLWDFYDPKNASDDDNVDLSLGELWSIIGSKTYNDMTDMKDVYDAFVARANSGTLQSEDGTGVTKTDVDQIFIAHGFFADLNPNNRRYDPGEEVGRAAYPGKPNRRNTPLVPGAFLLVRLQDIHGVPLDGSVRVAMHYDNPYYDYFYEVDVPDNGLLYLEPPPSDVPADVEVTGLYGGGYSEQPFVIDNVNYWNLVAQSQTGYATQVTLTVDRFSILLPLLLKNHPPLYTISGRITDNSGNAVSGATVSATGPTNVSTATGSDGRYILSDLPAGTYSVSASKVGYASPVAQSITVPPNVTNVDFVLSVLAFEFNGTSYSAAEGAFTKPIISLPGGEFTGPVVWTGGEGCTLNEIPPYPAPNQIALIQRGSCLFLNKAQNAQARGYAGFVVANDAARGDDLITMISSSGETVNIPGFFVGFSTGEVMKAASPSGILSARALFGGTCLAESPHPYPDNYNNTWTLINPDANAASTRIHFSRIETESGWDYVYVRDGSNNQINRFDGNYPSGVWSSAVPGRTVKVQLTSDGSVTGWGFCVDRIETVSSGVGPLPDKFLFTIGAQAPVGQFNYPFHVAVAPDGTVYVADGSNHRIQRFSTTGQFLGAWGSAGTGEGQFWGPSGIAVAPDSSVYIADWGNNRIQHFTANNTFTRSLGISSPASVSLAPDGTLYVAEWSNSLVRHISATGQSLNILCPSGSGDGQCSYAEGVTVASNGTVYVADTRNHRIQRFSANGTFLGKWGSYGSGDGQFNEPSGVAVASDGTVYIADRGNHRIQRFSATGQFLEKWGSYGSGDAQFNKPQGVAVAPDGIVYVADTDNHRIQRFSATGQFLGKWGSYGDSDGQFNHLDDVAVGGDGSIYVTDKWNNRIQRLSGTGLFLSKWGSPGSGDGQLNNPRGIGVAPGGTVYVADTWNHRIQRFTPDGTFLGKWGSYGSGDREFNNPRDVAIAPDGTVYVADTNNHRIQRFTADGIFLGKWGTQGSGDGQFNGPVGVAVATDGTVYVTDAGNNRVQRFTASGQFLGKWGSQGTGDGQFNRVWGIAIASDGTIYVTDWLNFRVQRFTSTGAFLGKWGWWDVREGAFAWPVGIAIATDGTAYVSEWDNSRIQAFGPAYPTTWRGEYFANRWLTERPVLIRDEAEINFNWGTDSPGPGVPADNFSARWQRYVPFDAGTYRFTVSADDGVRLWVDDKLLIEAWQDPQVATFSADIFLTQGYHRVRLEYYEGGGSAGVRLRWERVQ